MGDAVLTGLPAIIVGVAVLLGALAGIGRWAILPVVRLVRVAVHFFETFGGEPARDGLPARPGVVDRIIGIEAAIRVNGTGIAIGDAMARTLTDVAQIRGDVADHLEDVAQMRGDISTGNSSCADGLSRIEQGQVEAKSVAERAAALANDAADKASEAAVRSAEAAERSTELEARVTHWVEEGQVREQAYLMSLAELGIDVARLPRRDGTWRTRSSDEGGT